jgi:hypothetical protein
MNKGKEICGVLKGIRQQIADENDIIFETSECQFEGDCKGGCPKCDSEIKYLEKELNLRQQLGKVVTIAGISLGVAMTFSACEKEEETLEGDIIPTEEYSPLGFMGVLSEKKYSPENTLFVDAVENEDNNA